MCEGQGREGAWRVQAPMCVLACPQVLRNDRQGEGRRVKVRIKDLEIKKEQQRMRQKQTEKRLRYTETKKHRLRTERKAKIVRNTDWRQKNTRK